MKRSIIYILLFLTVPAVLLSMRMAGTHEPEKKDTGALRFDGMYYKEGVMVPGATRSRSFTYLRFYPTGQVVRVGSASKPDQVARWITKEKDVKDGKGKYKVKDNVLNFEVKVGGDFFSHEGDIQGDTLRLTVYSSSSNSSFQEYYYFYKTDFTR